jgi:uncharacterized protein
MQAHTSNTSSRMLAISSQSSDLKSHASVLDKLAVLRTDPRLRFMMTSYEKAHGGLSDVIGQFVAAVKDRPKADVRIIDTSGLPNEVAGPLTASIARLLFQYKVWQTRTPPIRSTSSVCYLIVLPA